MKINVSRICPKSVTGMKTFQMRMKMKVKTNENQRVSDLSKKRHKDENIPNAYENESEFTFIFIRIWKVLIPVTLFGQIRDTLILISFYFHFHTHLECFHSCDAFRTNQRHVDFQSFLLSFSYAFGLFSFL